MSLDFTCEFPEFVKCIKYISQETCRLELACHVVDTVPIKVCEDAHTPTGKVIITNNYITPGVVPDDKLVIFPNSWYGLYRGRPVINTNWFPKKNFNCFIGRMDPIRQSWLYLLVRNRLFDHGFVSFNMDISRHIQQKQCLPTDSPGEVFEQQFKQYCSNFSDEHNFLKNLVPYRNFPADIALEKIILDSKFSIVLETYCHDNRFILFSEKIFRCLRLPRPWVLYATKGSVEYLRNIGFDVLDDLVDHSYDCIDFLIDRQSLIITQCKKLSDIDIEPLQSRLEEAALHNQLLLDTLFKTWHRDVDASILEAVGKISNAI